MKKLILMNRSVIIRDVIKEMSNVCKNVMSRYILG